MICSMPLGLGPCKLHLSCHLAPCWALPIGGAREIETASLERGGLDPFDLLADTFRVFSVMVLLSGISSFCFFNLSPPFLAQSQLCRDLPMNSYSNTSSRQHPFLRDLVSSSMGTACSKLSDFNNACSVPLFLQPLGWDMLPTVTLVEISQCSHFSL